MNYMLLPWTISHLYFVTRLQPKCSSCHPKTYEINSGRALSWRNVCLVKMIEIGSVLSEKN